MRTSTIMIHSKFLVYSYKENCILKIDDEKYKSIYIDVFQDFQRGL